jgi:DNA-binding NarL/FixJ family response regulator
MAYAKTSLEKQKLIWTLSNQGLSRVAIAARAEVNESTVKVYESPAARNRRKQKHRA